MKEFPTPKQSIVSLFENMVLMFDSDAHRDVNLLYQFVFTDIDEGLPLHIRFSGGAAEYREGRSDRASLVIRTRSDVWLDIAGRLRSPVWALLTGKIKVEGDLSLLRLLPRLLARTVKTPAPIPAKKAGAEPVKALVLIGNPRKRNGLTDFYLSPFVEGMKQAGAVVEEIYLYEKKINHCLGCFACWTKTPGACIQKDDQKEILEKIEASQLLVYAIPLYYHSMPGLVKDHLDRQLPKAHPYFEKAGGLTRHPRRTAARQRLVLFSICGFPEIAQFDALVATMSAYARHDNIEHGTNVLIPGAMQLYYNPTRRSILLHKLELLRSAGEQVVREGSIREKILKEIARVAQPGDWIDGANLY